jgi:N,N-dimethylformamidase beta subunit-like protein
MYNEHEPVDSDIIISNPSSWVLNGTGLKAGDHLVGLLGYEVDVSYGNAPANTEIVAHTPYVFSGNHSTQYSDMTDYQAPSGAWVFAAGTVRWPWGLSNVSPWGPSTSRVSTAAQIITNNVLNRFLGINPSPTPSPSTSNSRAHSDA